MGGRTPQETSLHRPVERHRDRRTDLHLQPGAKQVRAWRLKGELRCSRWPISHPTQLGRTTVTAPSTVR